jgi:hypothetical protein
MNNNLKTLSNLCIEADMKGRVADREALGWALARLNELGGSKLADALLGKPNPESASELESLKAKVDELEKMLDFVCRRNRIDRTRMVNQYRFEGSLRG